MAKVNCGSFHIGADGCFHTRVMESKKSTKHKPKEPTELMNKKAAQLEADAEVCRRCTQEVCRGSARCIAKQRALQEKEGTK